MITVFIVAPGWKKEALPNQVIHNPDQYIADLRLLLSKGRKRVAILVGAGAPASIAALGAGTRAPLIPMIRGLTVEVLQKLDPADSKIVQEVAKER